MLVEHSQQWNVNHNVNVFSALTGDLALSDFRTSWIRPGIVTTSNCFSSGHLSRKALSVTHASVRLVTWCENRNHVIGFHWEHLGLFHNVTRVCQTHTGGVTRFVRIGSFSSRLRSRKTYTQHVACRCNSPVLEESTELKTDTIFETKVGFESPLQVENFRRKRQTVWVFDSKQFWQVYKMWTLPECWSCICKLRVSCTF